RRAIQRGAGFQQYAENFAAPKLGENSLQVDATISCFRADDFDARVLQLARLGRLQRSDRVDKKIAASGGNDAGFWRKAQPRVENHAKQTPAARQATAIGQQRVVGKNCADSA